MYTKQQQCVANNARWQKHPPELPAYCKFRLASWRFGYTCFPFNCHRARSPPLILLVFSSYFYLLLFSPTLPISLPGILPCIIHEWHACFTHHVRTAMLRRPEGVSTKPACNLLTHRATSSYLSSPITLNSWNGPLPDTGLVVIIMSFKEA